MGMSLYSLFHFSVTQIYFLYCLRKAGVALDSHLLLGKLHYAMGMFEESLNHYNEADLQSLTEKALPSRSLRIVAESYAIKGKTSK